MIALQPEDDYIVVPLRSTCGIQNDRYVIFDLIPFVTRNYLSPKFEAPFDVNDVSGARIHGDENKSIALVTDLCIITDSFIE